MSAQYQSGSAVFALGNQAAPTASVTVNPGSDLALVAAFWIRGAQASTITITSAVRDGQNLQVLGPINLASQTLYLLYLLNPNTGTAALTITPSLTANHFFGLHAAVASGIHQTDPPDDYDFATGTSSNPAVTTSPTADGGFIFAATHHEAATALTSADTSLLDEDHGAHVSSSSYALPAAAGPYTMDWTAPTSDTWVAGAMSFKVAANPNQPPAIALDTPNGATLPPEAALEFTATDPDGDDVQYEVDISDDLTFTRADGTNLADNLNLGSGANLHPNPQVTLAWTGHYQVDDRFGQSFTGQGGILDKIKLWFDLGGSPNGLEHGYVVVRVYTHQGIYGTSSAPLNPAAPADTPTPGWLAESDPLRIDYPTFTGGTAFLTFSGANRIRLAAGTNYVLIADWWADTADYENTLVFGGDTGLGHAGNAYVDGSSVANNGVRTDFDLKFEVWELFVRRDRLSETDPGFANTVDGADTAPFTSGQKIRYTVPTAEALPAGAYYWRARAKDPAGTGLYGPWSETRSFTVQDIGGVLITPSPAMAAGATIAPAIVLASISYTPAVAATRATGLDPIALLNSISLAPAAITVRVQAVEPATILGSLFLSPAAAVARPLTVDPTVDTGALAIAPDPVLATSATAAPIVHLGSLNIAPAVAGVRGMTLAPAVALGDITFAPGPVTVKGAVVAPAVLLGSVLITTTAAAAHAAGTNPIVSGGGGIFVTPAPIAVRASIIAPGVVLGSLILIPGPARATGVATGAIVNGGVYIYALSISFDRPGLGISFTRPGLIVSFSQPDENVV